MRTIGAIESGGLLYEVFACASLGGAPAVVFDRSVAVVEAEQETMLAIADEAIRRAEILRQRDALADC